MSAREVGGPAGQGGRQERRRLESLRAPEGLSGDVTIDTVGLYCPLPIIRTSETIGRLQPGQVLEIRSDDRVVLIDMPAWCLASGHTYLGFRKEPDHWRLFVRRV